jgi:hypothetical protein
VTLNLTVTGDLRQEPAKRRMPQGSVLIDLLGRKFRSPRDQFLEVCA